MSVCIHKRTCKLRMRQATQKSRRCRCCGGTGWNPAVPLGHVIPGLAGAARRSALLSSLDRCKAV